MIKNRILPGFYLLNLCAPFADTIFQFLTPKIDLVISRTVTDVMVWMNLLTSLLNLKPNLRGYYIYVPKIEQCAIFFLIYQEFNNAQIVCDSR